MVTQTDVAKRAGVSPITVSRVVNGLGNVNDETRARVEEVIRQLGYYPNRQAQALNKGHTRTLAFITPRTIVLPLYSSSYMMGLLSGLEMRSRELGWDLLLTTDHDPNFEYDFLRAWYQRKVDGLVFVGLAPLSDIQKQEIERNGVPCVCICDRIRGRAVSWIDTDNASAVREAIKQFRALGHTDLAYLGPDAERDYNPNFQIREQTFMDEVKAQGLKPQLLRTQGKGEAAAQTFLSMTNPPTAILAASDAQAISFMRVCKSAGVLAGFDYSIIGFDAEPAGQTFTPQLASFRQPLMEMGREAAELLVDLIQGEQGKHTRVFPMEWVDGGSLGPVPSGKRVAGIPHVSSLGGHSPEVSVPTLCTPR